MPRLWHLANGHPVLLSHVLVDLDDARVEAVQAIAMRAGHPVVLAALHVEVVGLEALTLEGLQTHTAVADGLASLRELNSTDAGRTGEAFFGLDEHDARVHGLSAQRLLALSARLRGCVTTRLAARIDELGSMLPTSGRLDRVHENLNLGRALGREDEAISVVVRVVGIRPPDVDRPNPVLDAVRTQHAHKVSRHPVWHIDEGKNAISSDASRRTAGIHLDAASGKPIAHGVSAKRIRRSAAARSAVNVSAAQARGARSVALNLGWSPRASSPAAACWAACYSGDLGKSSRSCTESQDANAVTASVKMATGKMVATTTWKGSRETRACSE